MFRATNFTYDGIYSEEYGLKIATINGKTVEETAYVVPTIQTVKPAKSKKFYYQGKRYDNPPAYQFSILSQEPISDVMQREILLWLDSRSGFKPLVIHQNEYEDYTYNCIFTITNIIYHAGKCIGFTVNALFDSPYQYAKPTRSTLVGTGEEKELIIYNKSDVIDEYVYPTLVFKTTAFLADNKTNIEIVNISDNNYRVFKFEGVGLNTKITVDNETKIIDGTSIDDFKGFKWLRLKRGKNILKIKINGEVEISCPQYIKIRF